MKTGVVRSKPMMTRAKTTTIEQVRHLAIASATGTATGTGRSLLPAIGAAFGIMRSTPLDSGLLAGHKETRVATFSDEQHLLARARAWEQAALEAIYDRYAPGLYRYAAHLLGDAHEAEECVAEVFARFLVALRQGKGPRRHLRAYLYRMAHNWIYDRFRERPTVPLDDLWPPPAATDNPAEHATRQWRAERLRRALRQLPPRQALVVSLRFLEGFSLEEVAAALGVRVGAVKALQHRGLTKLRQLLHEVEAP